LDSRIIKVNVLGYSNKGQKGDQGDIGETGEQGIQGVIGNTGGQGIQGIQGDSNIELIDGRVGNDGKVYPSTGDAIRGQINNVFDEINDLQDVVSYSQNILNTANISSNNYCGGFSALGVPEYTSFAETSTYLFNVKAGIPYKTTLVRGVFCFMFNLTTSEITRLSLEDNQMYLSFTPTNDSLVCLTFYNLDLIYPMIIENGSIPIAYYNYGIKYNCMLNNSIYNNDNNNAIICSQNILNTDDIVSNQYCGGFSAIGVPAYGTNTDVSNVLFHVKSGVVYNTTGVRAIFCYMFNLITSEITHFSIEDNYIPLSIAPTHDSLVCLTFYNWSVSTAMIIENNLVPDSFIPYGIKYGYQFKDSAKPTIYCGANRKYTTFVSALNASTVYNGATLIVEDGIYDLYEEMGGDAYFNSYAIAPTYYGGLVLKNNVKIYFSSKTKLVFNYTGNNPQVQTYFSPLNSGTYGFELHNLNLECSNCRYAIHDERNADADSYRNIYDHVNIKFDNILNTVWNAKNSIGGGMGANGEIIIDGCYFDSNITSSAALVSYHNSGASNAKSNILVKNSYFSNGNLKFSYHGTTTEITKIIVCGCSLAENILIINEEPTDVTVNVSLAEWNNIIRS